MSFFRNFLKSDDRPLMESMDTMDSWRANSKILVDLRKKPRYATQFPGKVIAENGNSACVTITNISRSGLRVEGNQPDLRSLMPSANHDKPHIPVTMQVHFSIPGPDNRIYAIRVQCKSVYVILGDYRDFKIGMQLITFTEGSAPFQEYISFRA